MTKQRVLGRVRLSRLTDESTSVERQKQIIQAWADAEGHTVVAWAVDTDLSRSVDPFKSPEFGRWLTDPEKVAQWDTVAAWRLDRYGAGSIPLNKMFEWCQQNGKTLYSATERLDLSTWVGRMIANVIAGVAEGELEGIRERTQGSREFLRTEGRWPGGQSPYWLKAKRADKGWTLVLDPYSSGITRRILAEFLEGKTVESTCADLTAEGVLTPLDYYRKRAQDAAEAAGETYTGKAPEGRPWKSPTVWKLLPSTALLGFVPHKGQLIRGEDGQPIQNAEPLLRQAEFDQIQAEITRRQAGKFKRDRNAGPLLGVIRCLECSGPMHHLTQHRTYAGQPKVYRYYRCPERHGQQPRADEVETATEAMFLNVLGPFEMHRRVYVPAVDNTAELDAAVRGLEELSRTAGTLTSRRAQEALSGQMRALDARIAELEQKPLAEARTELRPTGTTYRDEWKRLDTDQRRELLLESGITVSVRLTGRLRTGTGGDLEVEVAVPDDIRERLSLPGRENPFGPDYFPNVAKLREIAQLRTELIAAGADPDELPGPRVSIPEE